VVVVQVFNGVATWAFLRMAVAARRRCTDNHTLAVAALVQKITVQEATVARDPFC